MAAEQLPALDYPHPPLVWRAPASGDHIGGAGEWREWPFGRGSPLWGQPRAELVGKPFLSSPGLGHKHLLCAGWPGAPRVTWVLLQGMPGSTQRFPPVLSHLMGFWGDPQRPGAAFCVVAMGVPASGWVWCLACWGFSSLEAFYGFWPR